MGSNAFQIFQPYGNNTNYQWFLIQYVESDLKCVNKVVRTDQLIWKEYFHLMDSDDGLPRENVVLRDRGMVYLAYILYKSKSQEDCINRHHSLVISIVEKIGFMEDRMATKNRFSQLDCDQNCWVMVVYTRDKIKKDQMVIAVSHSTDVNFTKDKTTGATMCFIVDGNHTYKGLVISSDIELNGILRMLALVKKLTALFTITDMMRQNKSDKFLKNLDNPGKSKTPVKSRHQQRGQFFKNQGNSANSETLLQEKPIDRKPFENKEMGRNLISQVLERQIDQTILGGITEHKALLQGEQKLSGKKEDIVIRSIYAMRLLRTIDSRRKKAIANGRRTFIEKRS